MRRLGRSCPLVIALLCASCSGGSNASETAAEERPSHACEEPRPEVCAQLYDPVCAQRDTGIRCVTEPCDSSEPREYPNACEACRDPKVMSWSPGPC